MRMGGATRVLPMTRRSFLTRAGVGIAAAGMDGQVGVNAGSTVESDLRLRTPLLSAAEGSGSSDGWTAPLGASNDLYRQAIDLWPWLALGALAILMLEWGYIHR